MVSKFSTYAIIYASFIQSNKLLKQMSNKSFLCIVLILSADISLNPGPIYNNDSLDPNEWDVFKLKGIHLIHLNINSLLSKIEEICYIAECSNATIIGITESKLDKSIFQSEIQIDKKWY